MASGSISIEISGLSDRDKEQAAADLARVLKEFEPQALVEPKQVNPNAMDAGATLVLILGSGAGIAIARGIQTWIGRWKNASLSLSDGTRSVKVQNVSSADVVRIAELFSRAPRD